MTEAESRPAWSVLPDEWKPLLTFQGKQRIAYVANLGFDPLDTIPLRGEWTKNFTEVQMLDLDGQWKTVPATKTSEGTLQLQLPLAAHRVAIFRFL